MNYSSIPISLSFIHLPFSKTVFIVWPYFLELLSIKFFSLEFKPVPKYVPFIVIFLSIAKIAPQNWNTVV